MSTRRSLLRWATFINMACIKSVIDAQHYVKQGTVDTWFHGWQPLADHPIAAAVNILFDVGSVVGMGFTIHAAVHERKNRLAG